MSIVVNIQMPRDCRECPFEMYYMNCGQTWCRATNKILAENYKTISFDERPDWCPILELPEKHGRLIDAELLKNEFPHDTDWDYPVNTNCYVCESIDDAPTVIEAEGETL